MRSIAILDTGPIVAAADTAETHHSSAVETIRRGDLDLVVPALVVAEATYLIRKRYGGHREPAFLRRLRRFAIEPPVENDWPAIVDLVERYVDLGLGTVDAATVVLADRLGTDLIVTLDRRHFGAVQSPAGRRFRLLPEAGVHEEVATGSDSRRS